MSINVLLYPVGSLVAKEIYDALKYDRFVNVFGIDIDNKNWASFEMSKKRLFLYSPMMSRPDDAIEYLNNIVRTHDIKYVFPCGDRFQLFLSEHRDKIPCELVVQDHETCKICNDKRMMYDVLRDVIRVPKIATTVPAFVKPVDGYGSRDSRLVTVQSELDVITEKYICCEVLRGNEFTIDVLTFGGDTIDMSVRMREMTSNGISVLTKTVPSKETFKLFADAIQTKIKFNGPWFFQVKEVKPRGELCLLEVSGRIPGAMAASRCRGVCYPLLSLYDRRERIRDVLKNDVHVTVMKTLKNNVIFDRKFNDIYVDLDDTLVIKQVVNVELLRLLYRNIERGCLNILVTRNVNPRDKLKRYAISEELFDTIVTVNVNELKSWFVRNNSLFVDDSYSERFDVKQNKPSVIVLSPDAVEGLII
jgi:hypothetical protein